MTAIVEGTPGPAPASASSAASVAALLAYAGTALKMDGIAPWPCVPLHAGNKVWRCVCLRGPRA